MDGFAVPVLGLHAWRLLQICGSAPDPDGDWMLQPARNLTDCEAGLAVGKSHLIIDQDRKYTEKFKTMRDDFEIDIADPANPIRRATLIDNEGGFDQLFEPRGLAFKDDLLAIATSNFEKGVTLVDVSNPAFPTVVTTITDGMDGFNELDGTWDVAFQGDLLAITAFFDHSLTLADVSDPANPVLLAELKENRGGIDSFNGAQFVTFHEGILVVAASIESKLTLFDVTDPRVPQAVSVISSGGSGGLDLGSPSSVTSAGELLVVARGGGVSFLDVANPRFPILRGAIEGFSGRVAVQNELVAISTDRFVSVASLASFRPVGLVVDDWVGIGTEVPHASLHVAGDLIVDQGERIRLEAHRKGLGVWRACGCSGVST